MPLLRARRRSNELTALLPALCLKSIKLVLPKQQHSRQQRRQQQQQQQRPQQQKPIAPISSSRCDYSSTRVPGFTSLRLPHETCAPSRFPSPCAKWSKSVQFCSSNVSSQNCQPTKTRSQASHDWDTLSSTQVLQGRRVRIQQLYKRKRHQHLYALSSHWPAHYDAAADLQHSRQTCAPELSD